jgi:hypothetical protein
MHYLPTPLKMPVLVSILHTQFSASLDLHLSFLDLFPHHRISAKVFPFQTSSPRTNFPLTGLDYLNASPPSCSSCEFRQAPT